MRAATAAAAAAAAEEEEEEEEEEEAVNRGRGAGRLEGIDGQAPACLVCVCVCVWSSCHRFPPSHVGVWVWASPVLEDSSCVLAGGKSEFIVQSYLA